MNDEESAALRARAKEAIKRTTALQEPVDRQKLARIEDAVLRLSRVQREIFLAARIDSLSYAEIAEKTGLTNDQVKRQFAGALFNIGRNLRHPRRRRWRRWFR